MTDAQETTTGARLRAVRQARELSQYAVARMAGVSRQAISSVESGLSDPSLRVAFALSRALGMTVEELFGPANLAPPIPVRPVAPPGGDGARVTLASVGENSSPCRCAPAPRADRASSPRRPHSVPNAGSFDPPHTRSPSHRHRGLLHLFRPQLTFAFLHTRIRPVVAEYHQDQQNQGVSHTKRSRSVAHQVKLGTPLEGDGLADSSLMHSRKAALRQECHAGLADLSAPPTAGSLSAGPCRRRDA